ncbi:MAG TPA: amidohydrolase family protein [Bryobacteraceae bacterium]|nr:amidohydrolase family protein [Bryobacteraceae bacterium]
MSGEAIVVEADAHGLIRHVDPLLNANDADDLWIAPGFIDLQVNGFAGVDFNSPSSSSRETSQESIARAILAIASTGVTRFFPTVITGAPDAMCAALRNLAAARESLPFGRAMEAFHVEGPHISPEDAPRGAHPKEWVRPPDFEEFLRMQDAARGHIRLVTLAPEWLGAPDFIERLTSGGVVCAIGHTRATPAQIHDAVSAGATLSTHLGNGAGSRTRTEDFITAQLNETSLAASFIADGHHLPDEFLRRALETKGLERSILITDAVAPALCLPGSYKLGGVDVELRPVVDSNDTGRVTLQGGDRLAGSALRVDRAVENVMRIAGLTLAQAITLATTNPARVGKAPARLKGLQRGERADVVRFRMMDGRVEVVETYLNGELIFATAS